MVAIRAHLDHSFSGSHGGGDLSLLRIVDNSHRNFAHIVLNAFEHPPPRGLGFDPDLAPYPFDPGKAQQLLREAGYPDGLAMTLITPQGFEVQAIVISKILEQVGFTVERQVLDTVSYNQRVTLSHLVQSSEQQQWDIALTKIGDFTNVLASTSKTRAVARRPRPSAATQSRSTCDSR